jgi:hypothetical protein
MDKRHGSDRLAFKLKRSRRRVDRLKLPRHPVDEPLFNAILNGDDDVIPDPGCFEQFEVVPGSLVAADPNPNAHIATYIHAVVMAEP